MAMRQCIEYGYHHETPASLNASPLEIDMRRRLFWMTYKVSHTVAHLTFLLSVAHSKFHSSTGNFASTLDGLP